MNEVEAVKTKAEIEQIESLLTKHNSSAIYGDVWRFGVNTALRITDLLSLKYSEMDIEGKQFELVEKKTSKRRAVGLNATALRIIERRRKAEPTDIYLFQSHSNRTASMEPKPLNRVTVARAFKEIGEIMKVKLGTHSMRKSRGWAMHKDRVPIEMIAKVLNHSSPVVTMRYLGITQADVMKTYDDYEL